LNDSQQRAQQHGRFLKELPVLTYLQLAEVAAQATTVVVVAQAVASPTKRVLLSLEQ
jgi:hypothetical protein